VGQGVDLATVAHREGQHLKLCNPVTQSAGDDHFRRDAKEGADREGDCTMRDRLFQVRPEHSLLGWVENYCAGAGAFGTAVEKLGSRSRLEGARLPAAINRANWVFPSLLDFPEHLQIAALNPHGDEFISEVKSSITDKQNLRMSRARDDSDW